MPKTWIRALFLTGLATWGLLGVVNVYWANLNQDEGWYLYAALLCSEGMLPYRDFAFTQGPVMPYVYALIHPALAAGGLEAGRWFTCALAGVTLLLTARLGSRSVGDGRGSAEAGLIALILLGVNVYQSQFTTIAKTYSLCGLLLVSGLLLAQRAAYAHRPVSGLASGFLLGLAAATRLSSLFAIPVVVLFLLFRPAFRPTRAWIYVSVGAAAALAVTLLPFLAVAGEGLRFGMFEYHVQRQAGSLAGAAVYKAGFLSRVAGGYSVACALLVVIVCGWCCLRGRDPSGSQGEGSMQPVLWGVTVAITLVHLAAPFPYDDYQVLVFPVFCAALGAGTVTLVRRAGAARGFDTRRLLGAVCVILFLCCGIAAVSSPINQEWVLRERDRIWWRLKERSSIAELKAVSDVVRKHSSGSDLLLTQDLYLAVQAGRRVPHGLEMGPFSYFPDLSPDRARRLKVVGQEGLEELLRTTPARLAAVSGYGFAIQSPGVVEVSEEDRSSFLRLLNLRYRPLGHFPGFGQANTTVDLYQLDDLP